MKIPDILYQVFSYYNEYEDQGMRMCQCGVTLEKGIIAKAMENVIDQVLGFNNDFPVPEGSWMYHLEETKEGKYIFHITWKHDEDDRCFGIGIQQL